MTKLCHFNQYTRHDRNVWYSTCGVCVTDEAVIADLETQYQAYQRQHTSKGPQPPISGHYTPPTVRSKGRVKGREWRGETKP